MKFQADGTISWETMADAGEVDSDVERNSPISGGYAVANVFQRLNLKEPLCSPKYGGRKCIKRMATGAELSIRLFQKEGFKSPICIFDKEGLSMQVPFASTFGISDVRNAVGSRRVLDVMNVNTQTNCTMTMKEWHKYFETPPESRRDLYNVISLEFSNTKLDNQVKQVVFNVCTSC